MPKKVEWKGKRAMTTLWAIRLGATLLSGASLIIGAGSASAAPLTAADILSQFNAVVFGNFTSTSDVEGRLVVGGSMTGGGTFNIKPGSAAASSFAALTVYGSELSGGSFNINNGGGVAIAGSNSGTFNLNGGGTAYVGGSNTGGLNNSSGIGSITVGGSNSGTLAAGASSSVFVGGNNSSNVSIAGSGSVSVLGNNSSTISLSKGGTVYAGTSSGSINVDGGSGTVGLNGNNTGNVTLNGGGSVAIAGNTGNVSLNGGSLVYTGTQTGNLNINNGATAKQVANANVQVPPTPASPLPDFKSTFQVPLTALSTQLAGATANSSVVSSNGAISFNAKPDATGTAVFNIGTSLFANNATVTINLDGATSVIINVSVDGCSGGVNCGYTFPGSVHFNSPTTYADSVLWNFANATGINFATEFGGTVLAPYAAVSNSTPIDGTVIANSFTGNGEIHNYSYTGSVNAGLAVPEPGSLLIVGTGLAALGFIRRSRRAG
jgi:choice-of-anchor A domain-containing protein